MYCSAVGRAHQPNIFTLNLKSEKKLFFSFGRWNVSLDLSPGLRLPDDYHKH